MRQQPAALGVQANSLRFLAAAILISAAGVAHAGKEPAEPFLTDFAPPNARVLRAAQLGLQQYRESSRFPTAWSVQVDQEKGVIATNWYPDHKGEVELKVQIVVWGDSFRVDAWQKVGWVLPSVEKTDRSQRTERHIQELINKRLLSGSQ
jgi:hypothetical protein